VQRQNLLHGFQLDYDRPVDHEIEFVRAEELHRLIDDRERHLSLERDTRQHQLETETFLVRRFEQPRSE
jgi:hypothetical protein